MSHLAEIIRRLRGHRSWDPELWDAMERLDFLPNDKFADLSVEPRPLKHLSNRGLQARLEHIDYNIQYLDIPGKELTIGHQAQNWQSPWWWFQLRHWTMNELRRRKLDVPPTREIPPLPCLREDFRGSNAGARPKLFRISRVPYLMAMLEKGQLRFAAAASYRGLLDDRARADDEMSKGYKRAGHLVTIRGPHGKVIRPLGDVLFDSRRMNADMVDMPYWMLCFSTDADPRMFSEFCSVEKDDGLLAIFDVGEFKLRSESIITTLLPHVASSISEVNYFDEYYPPRSISPLTMKTMQFAYQREIRYIVDPLQGPAIAEGAFFTSIGSIKDIAAVYDANGMKLAGTGPDTIFA